MNLKILVCCHKESQFPSENNYLPIHVGKSVSNKNLGIQGDDTGDNISYKNASYCELTGMYWAWKNIVDVDIIGLCHYRRYFDFHRLCSKAFPFTQFSPDEINRIDMSIPEGIVNQVKKGKIVIPIMWHYPQTLRQDYCSCHNSDDYRVMTQIVKDTQPKYIIDAYEKVMSRSNKLIHYNMFLMKWDIFDSYCRWLFPLLDQIEKKIDISHYNDIQKRVFGYMAERLFTVWIEAEKKQIVTKPIIWFVDNPSNRTCGLLYKLRDRIWDIVNYLSVRSQGLLKSNEI